jgi:hypothetical protein
MENNKINSLKDNYDNACGSGGFLMAISEPMPVIEAGSSSDPKMFSNLYQNISRYEYINKNIFLGNCSDTNRNIHPEGYDVIMSNPPFVNTDQDLGDWLNLIIKKWSKDGRAVIFLPNYFLDSNIISQKNIREILVRADYIDCISKLPNHPKYYYAPNTPGCIFVLNRNKAIERRGLISMINDTDINHHEEIMRLLFDNNQNRNCITSQKYQYIFGICKDVKINDIACNDYNLSPELYVYEKEFYEESTNIKIESSSENYEETNFDDHQNESHPIITGIKSKRRTRYTNNDNILISQIPNRIEKAYCLDKKQLEIIKNTDKNTEKYKFSVVYFLTGEYEGSPAIYVGETHNFWDRITNHEKKFWDKVFLLTSRDKDEYWDKAQILYLESKFIYLYKKSNSYYYCINKNYSEKKLPESKIQTTEENFEYGKQLLSDLGLKIPE